jgi:Arm DNA-binding domain
LRKTNKLTTLSVKRMSKPGLYGDGDGLYLQVAAGGTKAWILRYMRAGRARKMGLGPFPILSLAEARQKAFEGRRSLLQGIDPIDARNAARTEAVAQAAKALTFAECGKAYIAAHQSGWRNEKHREQWSCQSRPLIPRLSLKCSSRSGTQNRKRRAGSEAGLKQS